jgi:hypothetical protein
MPPPQKINNLGQSCSSGFGDTRHVRLFVRRSAENFDQNRALLPRPLIVYSGVRTGGGRGKAGEGESEGEKIKPRTVPSPSQRQRQASACVYVYPSIPPKDSRAPPPSPHHHHHHLVSLLVVGTPRYAQWDLVVAMAHGDLRQRRGGCGCIRAVCADDDRRLCSVRMRTLVGRWLWGLHRSRRWVGGRVMIGGMR